MCTCNGQFSCFVYYVQINYLAFHKVQLHTRNIFSFTVLKHYHTLTCKLYTVQFSLLTLKPIAVINSTSTL